MIKKVQIYIGGHMEIKLRMLLIFSVLFLQSAGVRGEQMIASDTRIQSQISHIVSMPNTGEAQEAILREISQLKKMDTVEHLLQQLIYFRTNTMKMYNAGKITGETMEQTMNMTLYTIGTLLIPMDDTFEKISSPSAQILIKSVIPYLGTEDTDLKKQLYRMLKMVDLNASGKFNFKYSEYPVDYSEYKLFIEINKDKLSEPLVQYMYQKAPGEALITLANVYLNPMEKDTVIRDENIIREDFRKRSHGPVKNRPHTISAEAKQAFEQLSSEHSQWWVQMYIAEILSREPEFSTSIILEKLQKNKHPLILKVMGEKDGK